MINKKLSIVYVGPTHSGGTCLHRKNALIRLGMKVTTIDTTLHSKRLIFLYKAFRKLGLYVDLAFANRDLLKKINKSTDIVWIDKGLTIHKSTIENIRSTFPAIIVSYSPDDMINPDNQSSQYLESIPLYDFHITTKSYNVREMQALGAKQVVFVNNAFDPIEHTPSDCNYKYDVGFVGTYENDRAEVIYELARSGYNISVWGNWPSKWSNKLRSVGVCIHVGEVLGEHYSAAISKCRINLCFLRKINRDLQTTRSIEIPAMKGFMLAERSNEHLSLFLEGHEADFFSTKEELKLKIDKYLSDDSLREEVAKNGFQRCYKSEYSNDNMLDKCLNNILKNRE